MVFVLIDREERAPEAKSVATQVAKQFLNGGEQVLQRLCGGGGGGFALTVGSLGFRVRFGTV